MATTIVRPQVFSALARPALAPDALAVVFLALCTVALHWDALRGERLPILNDTIVQNWPFFAWWAEELKRGRFPLWNPYLFGGYPLFANGQVGMLYPLNLVLFAPLPTAAALVLARAAHTFLAALGAYLLARAQPLRPASALVAALAFALGSFMVAHIPHEDLTRSATWLPWLLWAAERALRPGGRWLRWTLLGGAFVALPFLGGHLQPTGMALGALGLLAGWRSLWPALSRGDHAGPALLGRLLRGGGVLLGVLVVGFGLGAVQWLPLWELTQWTPRGFGLSYDQATTSSLPPHHLVELIFPYVYGRLRDDSWYALWLPWETSVYAGVITLPLAALGALAGRWRRVGLWLALGTVALLLALGWYLPFDLYRVLWELPAFSVIRIPARFTLLLGLALALLAAYGAEALAEVARPRLRLATEAASEAGHRLRRAWLAVVLGWSGVALAALATALLGGAWLRAEPAAARAWLTEVYLAARHGSRISAGEVQRGLAGALSPTEPSTALALGLCLGGALLLWSAGRWPRQALQGVLVGVVALDLLLFARGFHRTRTLAGLQEPPAAARFLAQQPGLTRVLTNRDTDPLEPNRLVALGVADAGGYNPLTPLRHADLRLAVERVDNALLDLWGITHQIVRNREPAVEEYGGLAFRPFQPLLSGPAGNPTGQETFRLKRELVEEVRLVGALRGAAEAPDGAVVGTVAVLDDQGEVQEVPLRAGRELAEAEYREGAGAPGHRQAEVAFSSDRDGDPATPPLQLYFARLPLPRAVRATALVVTYTYPTGKLEVMGLGVAAAAGAPARSLGPLDRAKYEIVYQDEDLTIAANRQAYPRAFVVERAIWLEPGGYPLNRLTDYPLDPADTVLLEDGPRPADALPPESGDPGEVLDTPQAAEVLLYQPDRVLVRHNGPGGYLVLTDAYYPGWNAYVDGVPAPIYRGDVYFRAVAVPPGTHLVDFRFEPARVGQGAAISLATLGAVAGLLLAERSVAGRGSKQ